MKDLKSNVIVEFVFALVLFALTVGCQKESNLTLAEFSLRIPQGLDSLNVHIPEDNPLSVKKIELGKALYFDERLSLDATVSCAFCHNPMQGFSDGREVALGIYGLQGTRNTPTIINRIFSRDQNWDGRAKSLEEQILEHIQNPHEMRNTFENVVSRFNTIESYRKAFQRVFGTEVTIEGVAKAIAAFERTLMSGNAPFDQFIAGKSGAISESAQRGFALFKSERVNCIACHSGQNFTDEKFQNNGAGMDSQEPDWGRFVYTKNDTDKGKFKTPTLRDITRTAPFMHDGSVRSLRDVVEFYNEGGVPNKNLSKHVKPLQLTEQEKTDLVEFLKTLTGRNALFFTEQFLSSN